MQNIQNNNINLVSRSNIPQLKSLVATSSLEEKMSYTMPKKKHSRLQELIAELAIDKVNSLATKAT